MRCPVVAEIALLLRRTDGRAEPLSQVLEVVGNCAAAVRRPRQDLNGGVRQ
jgi:hypothetical protein